MSSATLKLILQLQDEASAALGQVQGALSSLGGAALVGVAAGLAGIGAAALSTASSFDQAQRQMQAQLGLTADEAANLGSVAQSVFVNNFGGSIEEASAAVAEVRQQLGALPNGELQAVTEGALSISNAFGEEMPRVVNAARSLMTDFGMSSQEALDFITKGFQDGLNSSGDFLDSITEYSPQFAGLGADAGQFFSTMETGLQGGMLGTDKAADMLKEFRLRFTELGDDAAYALNNVGGAIANSIVGGLNGATKAQEWDAFSARMSQMGIDTEMFRRQFEDGAVSLGSVFSASLTAAVDNGAISAIDAFNLIQGGIGLMDSEADQFMAGIALFGTQFEDMGNAAALGINTAATSLSDMTGATASLSVQYDSMGAVFQSMGRQMLVSIAPIGEALLGLANAVMPHVSAGFAALQPVIASVVAWITQITASIGAFVAATTGGEVAGFTGVLSTLASVGQGMLMPALAGIAAVLGGAVIVAIGGAIASFVAAAAPLLALGAAAALLYVAWQSNFGNIQGIVQTIWQIIQTVFTAISGFITEHGATIQAVFSTVWGAIQGLAETYMQAIHGIFQTILALLQGDWQGAFDTMLATLSGLIAGFSGVATTLGQAVVDGIVNALRAGVKMVVDAAMSLAGGAIDAVKSALKSSSPSKVFEFEVGPSVPQGMVRAFERGRAMVRDAAAGLAEASIGPFAGATVAPGLATVAPGMPAGGGSTAVSNEIMVPVTVQGDVNGQNAQQMQQQIRDAVRTGVNEAMQKSANRADIANRLRVGRS